MSSRVWDSSLEDFRNSVVSAEPAPAGVAVSAANASFAFGLLAKVLKVSGRRKDFSGDAAKLKAISSSATKDSRRMLQLAEEDIAAFNTYMASAKLPHTNDRERARRQRALDAALRRAIDVPLDAARVAAAGLGLCEDAKSMAHIGVMADLGAAASLLASSLRVFLLCVDSNIRQLASDASKYRSEVAGWAEREHKALRQAEDVLKHATEAISAAHPSPAKS